MQNLGGNFIFFFMGPNRNFEKVMGFKTAIKFFYFNKIINR